MGNRGPGEGLARSEQGCGQCCAGQGGRGLHNRSRVVGSAVQGKGSREGQLHKRTQTQDRTRARRCSATPEALNPPAAKACRRKPILPGTAERTQPHPSPLQGGLPTMSVHVSISLCQWPRVVRGATTRKGVLTWWWSGRRFR